MIKTMDISGFGGDYEACCQQMLTAGLKFLSDRGGFDWSGYKQFTNVTGICIAENTDAKALDDAILAAPMVKEFGATGAMHQAVVGHLHFIATHSYSAWLEELLKHRNETAFDLDDPEREKLVLAVEGKLP